MGPRWRAVNGERAALVPGAVGDFCGIAAGGVMGVTGGGGFGAVGGVEFTGEAELAQFAIKRKLTNVKECFVTVSGPYVGGQEGDGFESQKLDFDREEGTIAIADMASGQAYEVLVLLAGDRGGNVEFEIKLAGSDSAYVPAGSVTIPMNARRRSPAIGYVYATSIQIIAL